MQSVPSVTSRESRQVGTAGRPRDDGGVPQESSVRDTARAFDSASDRDWLGLLRDVAAIANSGGGEILVRLADRQAPIATSEIVTRLAQFTDAAFTDIQTHVSKRADGCILELKIGRAVFPLVFTNAGALVDGTDSNSRVDIFVAGNIYFWDGQKSEPATSRTLQRFMERLLRRVRRRWLKGIRRVVNQPLVPAVGMAEARHGKRAAAEANLQPVRIVTDPSAPALQPQDVDRLYPLRQKDLVAELNRRLGRRALNSYDIQAVRRHHRLDERPEFVFHLPGAGRRYSPAVMEWLLEQYERDADFFRKARAADSELLKLRRQKPR